MTDALRDMPLGPVKLILNDLTVHFQTLPDGRPARLDLGQKSRPTTLLAGLPPRLTTQFDPNHVRLSDQRGHRTSAMRNPVNRLTRRLFVSMLPSAAFGFAGCSTAPVQSRYVGPNYRVVGFETRERPGTIVVDPTNHFLYLVQQDRQSLQYDVGVGKEGYGWSGVAAVHDKQEWPDWYPTKEILDRKPEIMRAMVQLQSGIGMRGGPANPLGARALYLWQRKVDTLYRIHGTNEPDSIGQNVSSGCIRMRNEAVIDLYDRTPIGTKVVVLAAQSV